MSFSFTAYISNSSFNWLFFLSKKSSSSCVMLYVLWCNVKSSNANRRRYSPRECPQILSRSFFGSCFFYSDIKLFLNGFFLIFPFHFYNTCLLLNQDIFFHCFYRRNNLIRHWALDRPGYEYNQSVELCYSRYSSKQQITCTKDVFG